MNRRAFISNGLAVVASFGLAACQHDRREGSYGRPVYRYNEPPPAPAQGYRHRLQNGAHLRYDAKLGAYRVDDKDVFYFRRRYYRLVNGKWQSRDDPRQQWRAASGRELPGGLRRWGRDQQKTYERRRQRREDAN